MNDDELKAAVCRIFKFGEDKWFDYADEFRQLLAQARADEREAVKRVIDGGSFLHDKAPPRLWANEVLAAIDRDAAIRARKDA